MAGAGLRLSELNAGEGERGLLLYGRKSPQTKSPHNACKPWVPMHRYRKYFAAQRGEGQSKNPLVRSPVWAGRRSDRPAADANTVRSPVPTDSGRGRAGSRCDENVTLRENCAVQANPGQRNMKKKGASCLAPLLLLLLCRKRLGKFRDPRRRFPRWTAEPEPVESGCLR